MVFNDEIVYELGVLRVVKEAAHLERGIFRNTDQTTVVEAKHQLTDTRRSDTVISSQPSLGFVGAGEGVAPVGALEQEASHGRMVRHLFRIEFFSIWSIKL